jgi:very-short-patch-repair endonuclease
MPREAFGGSCDRRKWTAIASAGRRRSGSIIADFVCHNARLIIEIDGGQHERSSPDEAKRTRFLEDQGYRILRFWNNEVLSSLDGVCAIIARELRHHPHP